MTSRLVALSLLALCATLVRPWPATGQNNFEIQVYGSETVAPGTTMVELHSNVAAEGSRRTLDHVLRTQGAFHETLEITRASPRGSRQASTSSPASSPTSRGSGWAITSARACERLRAGIYPSASVCHPSWAISGAPSSSSRSTRCWSEPSRARAWRRASSSPPPPRSATTWRPRWPSASSTTVRWDQWRVLIGHVISSTSSSRWSTSTLAPSGSSTPGSGLVWRPALIFRTMMACSARSWGVPRAWSDW